MQNWLERNADLGVLFLRLIVAAVLIEGTYDNVFSWARMVEFEKFLAAQNVPMPLVGAVLSAWAQFLCGFLILFGAATRFAGAVMTINFIAAYAIAHMGTSFTESRLVLLMLASSLFFLFHGAGRMSVDAARTKRAALC